MARSPIDPGKAEAIVIDWRVGQMSQEDIARKHKVSKGTVNKLCKGVEQDGKAIVTAGIQYNQALKGQNDRMVTAVTEVVNTTVERLEWLNTQALKNVRDAMNATCDGQQDYRHRGATILAAKETIVDQIPTTAIQINNNLGATKADDLTDDQLAAIAAGGG